MKSTSPSESDSPRKHSAEDRLHWLAQRSVDEGLNSADAKELATLLAESEEARETYVGYCQLHTALGQESGLHSELAAALRPDNVVALPGARTVLTPAEDDEEIVQRPFPFGKLAAGIAAAAAIVTGVALLPGILGDARKEGVNRVESGTQPSSINGELPARSEKLPHKNSSKKSPKPLLVNGEDDQTPEEQYQSSPVLAQVSSGSQSRPPASLVTAGAKTRISFNRDIRPILSDNCFHCHGPDEGGRKADLRLDLRQTSIVSDSNAEAPIVPGDLEGSEFFARIATTDPDDQMPPPDSHKRLTPAQIALFRQWILEGAEWEEHWAFVAPSKDAPPAIESDWVRNDIDKFIVARLKEEGLDPSEEADRYTLIRRATLDLTGLPPTPEEVLAFVSDDSPEAYPQLIDRLLESKAYGEHRARYWLDAARYGDTHGLHLDNYREIWPYRDWVINAYNANLPFDQFTIQQLAGDLMPTPNQDQLVATGFNRCNVTTSEGGAIAEEFLVRYAVDRAATTATVWMGLTAGCAQCHNHKYDPISQREFYQLFAYFNNTTQPGMDGNAKDSPPVIRVFADEAEEKRITDLRGELAKVDAEQLKPVAKAPETEAAFQAWLAKADRAALFADFRLPGSLLEAPPKAETDAPVNAGNVGKFEKSKPFTIAFLYEAPAEDGRTVLMQKTDPTQRERGWRVVLEDRAINLELIESWPGKTLRVGVTRIVREGSSGHFVFSYDGSGTSEGIGLYQNGKRQSSRFVKEWFDTLEGDFLTEAPLMIGGLTKASGLTPKVSDVRLYDRRLSDAEIKLLTDRDRLRGIAAKDASKRVDKETGELRSAWLMAFQDDYRAALVRKGEIETAISAMEAKAPITLVMQEKVDSAPMAHILERGEYDKQLDEVSVGVPDFLPPLAEGMPANRLGLAQWLVNGQHPLTARVMVNRMWQELFGVGLVKTAEDFGTQGEPPSHPKLLDWLAFHFVDSGWDMKALYREMMLSATYRQSARLTPELRQRDPENRLLARGPRFRLDAEVIRDQALAAAGLLDPTVGGESVRPWQPGGIWEAVGYTNSNTQTFYPDFGGKAEHRRSLYTFWKRTAPPPNLGVFDAPNRESCTVRRERTNTPLQALVMMNDPQFLRATRHLAQRALNEHDNVDGRIDYLSTLLTGRPRDEQEKQVLKASLVKFQNAWGSDEPSAREFLVDSVNDRFSLNQTEQPVELASWTMVASQIMNLDESISKP
ncbi:MAG: DUF1553 domain-containing protein [Verrucomicrobiae bacterium]|nr:DUF1553 domain-containing protein [Verrucomicrobiae bacterium]